MYLYKNTKKQWLILALSCILNICLVIKSHAQEQGVFPPLGVNDTIKCAVTNYQGIMIPWFSLPNVTIVSKRPWKSEAEHKQYQLLRYNVLKAMPYAIYARDRYAKLRDDLSNTTDGRQRRQLIKACDAEIKNMFNTKVKDLTITQGRILTKLINRETGRTTYDIVRQTKGGLTAFLYQTIARGVGHNLKSTYDPVEDRNIEVILEQAGYNK